MPLFETERQSINPCPVYTKRQRACLEGEQEKKAESNTNAEEREDLGDLDCS